MIIGAHSIIYSTDPEADRAFLRDVLNLTNVDAGSGWSQPSASYFQTSGVDYKAP